MNTLRYRSWWIAAAWIQVILIVILGLIPATGVSLLPVSDKVIHFAEFFVLMVWFGGIYCGERQWLVFLGLAMLGIAIELAQGLNVFRTFDVGDIAANFVGLLVGLLAVRTVLRNWCGRVEQALG